jgi:hypothetical protein
MNLINEAQALALIAGSPTLQEIIRIDPKMRDRLMAAAQFTPSEDMCYWEIYETLKHTLTPYVGFDSPFEQLCTHCHYEAVIQFIVALLPDESYRSSSFECESEVQMPDDDECEEDKIA